MFLPFPTNAFSETVENAGVAIFDIVVISVVIIVVDTHRLILCFHKSVEKLSCSLGSFLL